MTIRFCPTCSAEVEDAGGFCLLGHDLRLRAPTESLAHLRAEVDRAFVEAELQMAMARHPASGSVTVEDERRQAIARHPSSGGITVEDVPGTMPAFAVMADDPDEHLMPVATGEFELEDEPEFQLEDEPRGGFTPNRAFAPAVSTPDPAPVRAEPHTEGVWDGLDEEAPPVSSSDPITAFSPPPRMDWGPDRPRLFRRRGARRTRSADL